MKAFLHGPCWRQSLGMALAVLAGALLAHGEARAGCGDHVVLTAETPAPKADIPTPSPMQPAKQPAPCTGPNCSRAPIAPPAAPAVPVAPGGQEWACVFTSLTLPLVTSSFHSPEERRERPLIVGSGVYHPPR